VKALVIGGSGTVGASVVSGLLAKGTQVRVLSRTGKKIPAGVEVAIGDLNDPAAARPAFDGVDTVFLLNGLGQTEANEGLVAVSLARAAKTKRLVYMSVQHAHLAPHVPHFGSKIGVEAAVKASGIPFTILQPNMFFQNDTWLREAIAGHGFYPNPIGDKGCNSVDARDIADAAVHALTTESRDFLGKSFIIAGPTLLTGSAVAQVWSTKVGKKVTYGGNDLDAWERQVAKMMPGWMVYDLKLMFRHFQEHGMPATGAELAACEKVVGHPLRTFEAFAEETVKAWGF
jgi:uncharacterized protein YbjT (DUF2867 family)